MNNNIFQIDEHRKNAAKRAVLLARVSTKEQEEGYSIAAQKHRLQQYCERKGFDIIRTFELVESSTMGDRKDFMEMLKFIKRQSGTVALVADKVDRVQRSFKEFPMLDSLIQTGKIELHFNTENYIIHKDSVSQERLMWSIGVVMAQSYVDSLSDNVKRSIDQKLRIGEWIGTAPIGYLNSRDERGRSTVIIDEFRSPLIRRMFEEYATGEHTLADLTRKAKEWGLRNARGNQGELAKAQVHRLIQNPFYYGEMEVKGKKYPHVYQPIITKELFDACQAVRLGWHKKPFKYAEKDYVFRGLMTCATTGRTITADTKTKTYPSGKTSEWTYLISWNPDNPKKKVWTREDKVLSEIEDVFQQMAVDADLKDEIVEYAKRSCETEKVYHKKQIAELNKEYTTIQGKLDKLTDLLLDDAISRTEHENKRLKLKLRQLEIAGQLDSFTMADDGFRDAVVDLLGLTAEAHQIFKGSSNEGKRRLINFVFSNLQLEGQKLRFFLRQPFDLFVGATNCQEWRAREDSNPQPPDP